MGSYIKNLPIEKSSIVKEKIFVSNSLIVKAIWKKLSFLAKFSNLMLMEISKKPSVALLYTGFK